jgi:hypothetical protein
VGGGPIRSVAIDHLPGGKAIAVAERPVNGEIDVAYSSPEAFGRIALEWLTEGVQILAGDMSDEILALNPPLAPRKQGSVREEDWDLRAQPPPLWGEVHITYGPRNTFYARPYTPTSVRRLKALAPELRDAWIQLWRITGGSYTGCVLAVHRRGDEQGFAQLISRITPDATGDYTAARPEVVFMRNFADRYVPLFGHISYDTGLELETETQLAQALNIHIRNTLPEWDRYLRGYSWVTVVPEVLAGRVGGMPGLRESGAFTAVEALPGGSVWLEAAPRWSEYQAERVDRVFEALAPVLPPGMPQAGQLVRPGAGGVPEIRLPYLLSIRDASAFHPAQPGA